MTAIAHAAALVVSSPSILKGKSIKKFEYRFVVQEHVTAPASDRFVAMLGEYDLDSRIGIGSTPAEAILTLVEMHGEELLVQAKKQD